jgi:hypothetical protein
MSDLIEWGLQNAGPRKIPACRTKAGKACKQRKAKLSCGDAIATACGYNAATGQFWQAPTQLKFPRRITATLP